MLDPTKLQEILGRIDIYLLDQVLRGHIRPGMRILDVGCGQGRNLVYFLRSGFDVAGLDPDPEAVASVRALAQALAPHLPEDTFRRESTEASSFPNECAEVVICNAVLHFSRDHDHFDAQLDGAWRLLTPGGFFFARLGSRIGLTRPAHALGGGRYRQPDGEELYLVDLKQLLEATDRVGGRLVDPIKTTNVQEQRCMTTWVMQKPI